MNRTVAYCITAGLLVGAAFTQPSPTGPKFLAADIHKSPFSTPPAVRGPFYGDNRYEVRYASMVDLLHLAYDMDQDRIDGGPSWIEMDRFDVLAQAPAGSNAETRKQMLRELLTDRFHVKTHTASRPLAAYALTAGKHGGLKESDGTGEPGCKLDFQNPQGGGGNGVIQLPTFNYTCHNVTMTAFATQLAGAPTVNQSVNNKPIVDETDLKGSWDFNFHFTPKVPANLQVQVKGEEISVFDAIDKQLGLKLEASNIPVPMIVVDSADRQPTPNPANIAEVLPPTPQEFDVAEIKAAPPQTGARQNNSPPEIRNGRVFVTGITLQNLIQVVWDMQGDEFYINAPKWWSEDRFDVVAKAPAGVALGDLGAQSQRGFSLNIDALRPMLKNLIIKSFQMKFHMEERDLNAYILSATKPKLAKADPSERTKWHEGPPTNAAPVKNAAANSALGREVTCQNVTMAQFAEMIPSIAPGYVRTAVVDKTGLEGGYDFTFHFSPAGALNQVSRPSGDSAEASDPNGAISLFDAMSKQLGLKLEQIKRPAPVLVFDHIERTPAEN